MRALEAAIEPHVTRLKTISLAVGFPLVLSEMRIRNVLASTHLLNFLIGMFAIGYLLSRFWNNLDTWQFFFYLYTFVLCFSGITVASWIILDGNRIEQATLETRNLEQRISDLEAQIKKIRQTELLLTRFKD